MLHHRFGNTHCVDRICRLIGREAYNALNAAVDRRVEHIVSTLYVGADSLHREELAGRHLLQCSCMENIVDAPHRILDRLRVADITDVEFNFIGMLRKTRLQIMAHIILLLLITRENADLTDIARQKVFEYSVTK